MRNKIVWIIFFCWIFPQNLNAQAFLHSPILGTYGKDFIIVNYVDWGQGKQISDYQCGNKTYLGHQGTDFVIRNFSVMDSGINVISSADGVAAFVMDTLFDREKQSVLSKGFGNFIVIAHNNKYYTYYAHLKQNSAVVSVGDSVKAGDVIGQVGSSGNSSDPHLHFELWYDSLNLVDPFAGACGNKASLWLTESNYDSSFQIWSSSLCDFVPDLDTLREEPIKVSNFTKLNESITYWNIMYGLKQDDSLILKWFTPEGIEWVRNGYKVTNNYWYYYFWHYINVPSKQNPDFWKVVLYRNNNPVDSQFFKVQNTNALKKLTIKTQYFLFPNPNEQEFVYLEIDKPLSNDLKIDVTNSLGQIILSQVKSDIDFTNNKLKMSISTLQSGMYSVKIRNNLEVAFIKLVIKK